MKAQKSWGPWQLNLNDRVQGLWPAQLLSQHLHLSGDPALGSKNATGAYPQDILPLTLGLTVICCSLTNSLIPQSWETAPLTPPGALHPHPALPQGTLKMILSPSLPSAASLPRSRDLNFFWLLGAPPEPLNQERLPRAKCSCSHQPATCQAHGDVGAQLGALPLGLLCGLAPPFLPFLASVTATCEQCTLCAPSPLCAQACKTLLKCDLQGFSLGLKLFPWGAEQGWSGWRCLWRARWEMTRGGLLKAH